MRQQKRGRRIAMTPAEVDAFLAAQRTCRVASAGADGRPHVVPLWFVWDGTALWLTSLVRSQRWTDLARDPRVAVVVDAGEQYDQLRGVEIAGTATPVGGGPAGGHRAGRRAGRAGAAVRPQVRRDRGVHPGRPARLAAGGPGEGGQLGLPQDPRHRRS